MSLQQMLHLLQPGGRWVVTCYRNIYHVRHISSPSQVSFVTMCNAYSFLLDIEHFISFATIHVANRFLIKWLQSLDWQLSALHLTASISRMIRVNTESLWLYFKGDKGAVSSVNS